MSLYSKLSEKSFLKKLLLGVDAEFTERLLRSKAQYETTKEKEEKRILRDKMTSLYWELFTHVAKMINPEMSSAKRLFLRYGLFDLRYLNTEDQKMILEVPVETPDYDNEVVFYVDEWLQGIASGKIRGSVVDETGDSAPKQTSPSGGSTDQGRIEKYQTIIQVERGRHEQFLKQRNRLIERLSQIVEFMQQDNIDSETDLVTTFNPDQTKEFDRISDIQKEIRKLNKEIVACLRTIQKSQESLSEYQDSAVAMTMGDSGLTSIVNEIGNIRQMIKMTVGRQGNSFPYLTSSNMPRETKEYLFKDTVKKKINKWLELDPEAFNRTYKGQDMAVKPYFILVPGYGSMGVCWEPLDPSNKQFGKGRLCLPIFSRTPDISLLSAIGDARWQVAKEIASYYWMEEGITGRYYEYYLAAKLKGDLKSLFVKDYILWMTKETQGVQKLENDARYVFWRYVPMPDARKIELSKKGYYYNQLWEKEQVWRQGQEKK